MVKKSMLIVLMVMSALFLVAQVTAVPSLTSNAISGTLEQGSTTTIAVTLTNPGPETVDLDVVGSFNLVLGSETLSATVSQTSFNAFTQDDTASFTITVTSDDVSQALGVYSGTLAVTVDDGTASETQNFAVSVTLTEDNTAPVFTGTPQETVIVNTLYSYQATATDADGDSLTFALVSGPSGLTVSPSGMVSWNPSTIGNSDVTISVSDDEFTVQKSWTITVVSAVGDFSLNTISIGDNNQERDETVTQKVIITNTGGSDITNFAVALSGFDSEYEATVSSSTATIPIGGTAEITLTLYIPEDKNAGADKVGTLTTTGTSNGIAITKSADVEVEAANHLEIKKVKMYVADDSQTVSDGDNIDDGDIEFRPGDDVEFTIEIENTFDENDYDFDIEDIDVFIEQDDDLDWDEDDTMGDLRAEDSDEIIFKLDFPTDADETDYSVTIRVEGVDENGAEHSETIEFTLDVQKNRDDIRINSMTVDPSQLECGERGRVIVRLENVGSNDQDEIVLRVSNDELSIDEIVRDISIDEDDELSREVSVRIPSDADADNYFFLVEVYTSNNDNDRTDLESVPFSIRCGSNTDTDDTDTGNTGGGIDVVTPPSTTTPPPSTGNVIGTATGRTKSGISDTTLLILMVVVIALLVILIILLSSNKK